MHVYMIYNTYMRWKSVESIIFNIGGRPKGDKQDILIVWSIDLE